MHKLASKLNITHLLQVLGGAGVSCCRLVRKLGYIAAITILFAVPWGGYWGKSKHTYNPPALRLAPQASWRWCAEEDWSLCGLSVMCDAGRAKAGPRGECGSLEYPDRLVRLVQRMCRRERGSGCYRGVPGATEVRS